MWLSACFAIPCNGVRPVMARQSERGSRFVESILTVFATCQQHQQNAFAYLTACCRAYFQTAVPPALIPQPG